MSIGRAKHAFGEDVEGFYKVEDEDLSRHYDLIETMKIKVELLHPIMRGKYVSRWMVYPKRHKIMEIINTEPDYEPARIPVERLIEEAKESF